MKKKRIIIISIISLLVLIIAAVVVYILFLKTTKNTIICEITRDEETKSTYTKTVAKFDKNRRMLNYQDYVVITYKNKDAYEEGKKIKRTNIIQKFNDKKMTETFTDYLWKYGYADDSVTYSVEEYRKDMLEDGYRCKIK